jgi:hypothetical protein
VTQQGIVLFAHNNGLINYGSMAAFCAKQIHAHMTPKPICLVTDELTWVSLTDEQQMWFDSHVLIEPNLMGSRSRTYRDGYKQVEKAPYYNDTRTFAYDLTPFDETLVLDLDYVVFDNTLDQVWGSNTDLLINTEIAEVRSPMSTRTFLLDDLSVPMFWATVFYFRKTERVRKFFKILEYLADKYQYYSLLYGYQPGLYRNDHTFSMASHIHGGYNGCYSFAKPLPNSRILTSWDTDEVLKITETEAVLKTRKARENDLPVRITSNFHCMNKRSLLSHINAVI